MVFWARALMLCDCRVGVMRGAKWLVRHKMATPAWDLPQRVDERSTRSRKYARAGPGAPQGSVSAIDMTSIQTRAGLR
jgi:hypothetical protein